MEKNRESAKESRKRKANYMQALEDRIEALEQENLRLHKIIDNYKDKDKLS